jgi:hypothetical protein
MLTPPEQRRLLAELSFVLAVPRRRVTFNFAGPLGELKASDELYAPIVDLLAERPVRFDELLRLPAFGEAKAGQLLDCLALLVHSAQVLPVIAPPADLESAKRFNRQVVENARAGRFYFYLASPVTRTGIPISDFGLLSLAALFDGETDASAAARHALTLLNRMGRRPMKDGRLLQDDAEATEFLAQNMAPVFADFIPVWRRLGVL